MTTTKIFKSGNSLAVRLPREIAFVEGCAVTVYAGLGVKTLINAKGPATRLSGGVMRKEVAAAMAEADWLVADELWDEWLMASASSAAVSSRRCTS